MNPHTKQPESIKQPYYYFISTLRQLTKASACKHSQHHPNCTPFSTFFSVYTPIVRYACGERRRGGRRSLPSRQRLLISVEARVAGPPASVPSSNAPPKPVITYKYLYPILWLLIERTMDQVSSDGKQLTGAPTRPVRTTFVICCISNVTCD